MPRPSKSKMRGVAVIIALFIMAVVAAIAVAMMGRLQRDTHRASLIVHAIQAELYAQASVYWAADQLRNNFERKQTGKLVDVTPIRSPVETKHGYKIVSTIEDAQGRFNINNLSMPDSQKDFAKLLTLVQPGLSNQQATEITQAAVDWINPGARNTPFDKYYEKLNPSYRGAHRQMLDITELRLLKGMTPKLFATLLPYVIGLPGFYPVNIQGASAPVLASLSQSMTLEAARTIEARRKATPFITLESFAGLDVVRNNPIPANKLTISSVFFLVTTQVAIGDQEVLLYTLLMRATKNDKPEISIVWQSKGIV